MTTMRTPDAAPAATRAAARPLGTATRAALLLVFAVLVAAKLPDILLQGRFWAEEGNKFLENAWLLPWNRALLAPWGGYLNITANLAGLLAWHVPPLAWAPYASTLFALAFQLCPAILVLTSGVDWLERRWVMLAALLLLLTVPAADEVWLSSIGTQCHLNLCVGIILALATRPGAVALFRLFLLLSAALSGPGAWALAPLFVLRAALERAWGRALQAAVLSVGVLLQIAFFYSHEPGRQYAVRPWLFIEIAFTKHVLIPFIGLRQARSISWRLYDSLTAGHLQRWPIYVMIACGLLATAAFATSRRSDPRWLALGAVVLAGVSYVGALGNPAVMLPVENGGRYVFATQALLALAILGLAATERGMRALAARIVTVWWIGIGAAYFFDPVWTEYAHGPSWRRELALHLRDPAHVVAGWPTGWQVPLPPNLPASAGAVPGAQSQSRRPAR